MKQGYPYKDPGSYRDGDFGSKPPGAHDSPDPQPKGEFLGAFNYLMKNTDKMEKIN